MHGRKLPWDAVITRAFFGRSVCGSKGDSVKGGLPAGAEFGVIELSMGVGSGAVGVVIVNGRLPEAPIELEIVTAAVPGNAVSIGVIAAVSCVALTYVVVRADPFQLTNASLVKFVPVTVSVIP